jgi:hypothetical protein
MCPCLARGERSSPPETYTIGSCKGNETILSLCDPMLLQHSSLISQLHPRFHRCVLYLSTVRGNVFLTTPALSLLPFCKTNRLRYSVKFRPHSRHQSQIARKSAQTCSYRGQPPFQLFSHFPRNATLCNKSTQTNHFFRSFTYHIRHSWARHAVFVQDQAWFALPAPIFIGIGLGAGEVRCRLLPPFSCYGLVVIRVAPRDSLNILFRDYHHRVTRRGTDMRGVLSSLEEEGSFVPSRSSA